LTRRNLWLSPWTWWYRYYYRLDTPQFMIIAWTWWYRYYYRRHTPVYSYHLEPGDIIIIILTHAANYDYRLNLVISILLSPWHTPQFMIIAWTWWYRYYYRLDTPQFMIIALNLVISILLSPCHNLWLSPWTAVISILISPWQFTPQF
jgi:hypothetical protein